MAVRDVTSLLGDRSVSWGLRLAHLQGWRGAEAVCADAAPFAQRIGPAVCAVGGSIGAVLESPPVLAAFAATAVAGAVAPNHPFEAVYNRLAHARHRRPLPPNRAAKRLGCAIGVAFLGGAAVAYAAGAATAGHVLAVALTGTASFVAITGICIPSMIFTAVWGADRAAAPRLLAANQHGSGVRR